MLAMLEQFRRGGRFIRAVHLAFVDEAVEICVGTAAAGEVPVVLPVGGVFAEDGAVRYLVPYSGFGQW